MAVVLLLLIYCLTYFPLFVAVLCLYLFCCYALLSVQSSFAIILRRKKNLVALLLLSYRCFITNALNVYGSSPRGAVGGSAVCDWDIS